MKTVVIKSEATITVPKQHWQPLLQALSLYHRTRFKSHADMFVTDTQQCPLADLLWHDKVEGRETCWAHDPDRKTWHWLRNVYQDAQYRLDVFRGDLTFVKGARASRVA